MAEVVEFSVQKLRDLKMVHYDSREREQMKSFRDLRTRIYDRAGGSNFVCLVTSVAPGGGGSFVARNLAATVTLDKTKTALLVDCNLYSPSAEVLLPVEPMGGLTDFLDDHRITVDEIVYASGVPRLRVIPVGNNRDGGTEKIMSERMQFFVNDIKNRYKDRIVLIDGPAVGEYQAEIRILAELCDFVVLVVPDDMVTDAQLTEAIAAIGKDKVVGLVLNKPAA